MTAVRQRAPVNDGPLPSPVPLSSSPLPPPLLFPPPPSLLYPPSPSRGPITCEISLNDPRLVIRTAASLALRARGKGGGHRPSLYTPRVYHVGWMCVSLSGVWRGRLRATSACVMSPSKSRGTPPPALPLATPIYKALAHNFSSSRMKHYGIAVTFFIASGGASGPLVIVLHRCTARRSQAKQNLQPFRRIEKNKNKKKLIISWSYIVKLDGGEKGFVVPLVRASLD